MILLVDIVKMSASKPNISDKPEEESNPDPSCPEDNKEQNPTPSTDTQQQKQDTQISLSSKIFSHDNEDVTKDDTSDTRLLPQKQDPKEAQKEKSPNTRIISSSSNKITPLQDSKVLQGNGNIIVLLSTIIFTSFKMLYL